jgi:integrating conjugative element protein (TIGR03749 family)
MVVHSAFGAEAPEWRLLSAMLVIVLLLQAAGVSAAPDTPERIAWRKTPIAVDLTVGAERLVHFPGAVKVGVPTQLQGALRVQSIAGTLYLLASRPFAATRMIVRGIDTGHVYLLDLSAVADGGGIGPIEIFLSDEVPAGGSEPTVASGPPQYGYVTLTRFAAQQMYAPARLLHELPGVVRVPIKREPVALVRGDTVEAVPLVAWRAGHLYVTAAKLTNTTNRPQTLDPRTLRGRWLTAAFQHNRLHEAGNEADRTVVYLISDRPFAASLR